MSTLEGLFSLEQADGDNNLYRIDNSGYLANEEFNPDRQKRWTLLMF
jgi:hypothetical protein